MGIAADEQFGKLWALKYQIEFINIWKSYLEVFIKEVFSFLSRALLSLVYSYL